MEAAPDLSGRAVEADDAREARAGGRGRGAMMRPARWPRRWTACAFWLRGEGPLADAMAARGEATWTPANSGCRGPTAAHHPRRSSQRRGPGPASGRDTPVKRILDALAAWRRSRASGAGLKREAELFAEAVCDPESGRRASAPSSSAAARRCRCYRSRCRPTQTMPRARRLEAEGASAAAGRPFYPGVTPIPSTSTAWGSRRIRPPAAGVTATRRTPSNCWCSRPRAGAQRGAGLHPGLRGELQRHLGDHGHPGLAFDARDADLQVTGSGGVALIAEARRGAGARGPAVGRPAGDDLLGPERAAVARPGARPDGRGLPHPGLRGERRQPRPVPRRAGTAAASQAAGADHRGGGPTA